MSKPIVCLFNGKIAKVGNVVLGYKAPPSEFLFVKIVKNSDSSEIIFNEISSPEWEEAKTSPNSNMSDSTDIMIGSDASRYTILRYPLETSSITFPRIISSSIVTVYYYVAASMSTIGGYFGIQTKSGTGGTESSITLNVPAH